MNTKKNVSLLCVLAIVCLLFTGCPKQPKQTTEVECTVVNGHLQCKVKHTLQWRGTPSEIESQTASNTSGIFDLANEWQPDTAANSSATIKITKDDNQVIQSDFAVQLSSSNNNNTAVSAVDNDTTSNLYVFQNPSNADNFVSQSLVGESEAEIAVTYVIPIKPIDCGMSSGKQTNHVRYSDPSGLSYLDSFALDYSIPTNAALPTSCQQATVSIAE